MDPEVTAMCMCVDVDEMIRLHDLIKHAPQRNQVYGPKSMNDYDGLASAYENLLDLWWESVGRSIDNLPVDDEEKKTRRQMFGTLYHNACSLGRALTYGSVWNSEGKRLRVLAEMDVMLRLFHAWIDNPQLDRVMNLYGYLSPNDEHGQEEWHWIRFNWNDTTKQYEVDKRDIPRYIQSLEKKIGYYKKCRTDLKKKGEDTELDKDILDSYLNEMGMMLRP